MRYNACKIRFFSYFLVIGEFSGAVSVGLWTWHHTAYETPKAPGPDQRMLKRSAPKAIPTYCQRQASTAAPSDYKRQNLRLVRSLRSTALTALTPLRA